MKARLPKEFQKPNMNQMLQQMQKAQEDMAVLQDELDEREYTASSGGGAVTATVSGKKEVISLEIDPEVIDPEDAELLSDMVIGAVNEALRKADETSQEEMGKLTSGLGIPGM